jgi:hypothetical protein
MFHTLIGSLQLLQSALLLPHAEVDEVRTKEEKRMHKYLFTYIQTCTVEVFLRAHHMICSLVSLQSFAVL